MTRVDGTQSAGASSLLVPSPPLRPSGQGRVAALHRQGGQWRLVVAEINGEIALIDARTIDGDPEAAIQRAAREFRVERLVRIAPGRATVCRIGSLPAGVEGGNEAETLAALALLAEAELPAALPAHRRAAGIIPDAERGESRTVLMTGWSGPAPGATARAAAMPIETWTTEVAALAMLRGALPTAHYADPAEGTIAVLISGPARTAARVLMGDASTPEAWAEAVASAVGETAESVGASAPEVDLNAGAGASVRLAGDRAGHRAFKERVRGVPDDPAWLDRYGVALGAVLVVGAPGHRAARGLAALSAERAVTREPVVRRAVGWLSRPRNAWGVLAASLALLVLAPLGVAAARHRILAVKAGALDEQRGAREGAERRAALYAQLEQDRWPMTKLLGDVSAATPVGVVAGQLRLSPEQGLALEGVAESQELVNTLQANLNATRLFRNVKINRVESRAGPGVQFDLSADAASPHAKVAAPEDFATRTLAVRLYGEGASNTAGVLPTAGRGSDSGAGRTARRPPGRREEGAEDGEAERRRSGDDQGAERSGAGPAPSAGAESSRRPSATPAEAPPALTDEQIGAMDKSAAMKEWIARKVFVQKNPSLEAPTKERLEGEITKLKDQMGKAGSPSGAGAAGGAGKAGEGP